MQGVNRSLRLQRNIAVALSAVIIASNLLFALKVHRDENTIVLVPTIDRELKVGTSFVSDEYLRLRAEQLLYLLFSMKKENIDFVTKGILKQVDGSSLKEFQQQLEKLAEDIKLKGYRYWFTDIQSFEINPNTLTVKINGYLETYLADKQIERKFKEFELSFINRQGVVNLVTFAEVKNEKNS